MKIAYETFLDFVMGGLLLTTFINLLGPQQTSIYRRSKLNFENFTKCPSLKFFSAKTGKCALNLNINSKIG